MKATASFLNSFLILALTVPPNAMARGYGAIGDNEDDSGKTGSSISAKYHSDGCPFYEKKLDLISQLAEDVKAVRGAIPTNGNDKCVGILNEKLDNLTNSIVAAMQRTPTITTGDTSGDGSGDGTTATLGTVSQSYQIVQLSSRVQDLLTSANQQCPNTAQAVSSNLSTIGTHFINAISTMNVIGMTGAVLGTLASITKAVVDLFKNHQSQYLQNAIDEKQNFPKIACMYYELQKNTKFGGQCTDPKDIQSQIQKQSLACESQLQTLNKLNYENIHSKMAALNTFLKNRKPAAPASDDGGDDDSKKSKATSPVEPADKLDTLKDVGFLIQQMAAYNPKPEGSLISVPNPPKSGAPGGSAGGSIQIQDLNQVKKAWNDNIQSNLDALIDNNTPDKKDEISKKDKIALLNCLHGISGSEDGPLTKFFDSYQDYYCSLTPNPTSLMEIESKGDQTKRINYNAYVPADLQAKYKDYNSTAICNHYYPKGKKPSGDTYNSMLTAYENVQKCSLDKTDPNFFESLVKVTPGSKTQSLALSEIKYENDAKTLAGLKAKMAIANYDSDSEETLDMLLIDANGNIPTKKANNSGIFRQVMEDQFKNKSAYLLNNHTKLLLNEKPKEGTKDDQRAYVDKRTDFSSVITPYIQYCADFASAGQVSYDNRRKGGSEKGYYLAPPSTTCSKLFTCAQNGNPKAGTFFPGPSQQDYDQKFGVDRDMAGAHQYLCSLQDPKMKAKLEDALTQYFQKLKGDNQTEQFVKQCLSE